MRDFLKGLDLDKETIDTIMAEYGKNVQGLKEQIEEYKGYKTENENLSKQLEEKEKSMKGFEDVSNENKSLKAQLKLNENNIKKEFSKFVISEIMSQVDDKNDFDAVLKSYKKDNPQYFGDTVIKKTQTSPSLNAGGDKPQTTNDIMNSILRGNNQD